MLNAITQGQRNAPAGHWTPASTLRAAFMIWVCLLITPLFPFLYVVWRLAGSNHPGHPLANTDWFFGCMVYLLLVVPAAFFQRTRLFHAYWTGKPVPPRRYLWGMVCIWVALVAGGLLSIAGCLIEHSLLPNLVPALIAFMFYITFWPSGRAMHQRVGGSEDAAVYEEPR